MILGQIFEELAGLVRAPALILAKLTTMEERIMAELEELEQAIRDEVAEVITATMDEARGQITAALGDAEDARDAQQIAEGQLVALKDRMVILTGQVRAPGAFGQTTNTTTDTTTATEGPI